MRKKHDLKTWPVFFTAITSGFKTFEIRKNDRDYNVGDFLLLQEWGPAQEAYTGRDILMEVTYVLHGGQFPGLEKGYCAISCVKVF